MLGTGKSQGLGSGKEKEKEKQEVSRSRLEAEAGTVCLPSSRLVPSFHSYLTWNEHSAGQSSIFHLG